MLNKHLADSVKVISGDGSLANLDSLELGRADFGIVDNYSRFSDNVAAVLPLYPQLLHILYRKEKAPQSLQELFSIGKIFAGIEGSGTRRFVDELMKDLGIDKSECSFVDVYDFFEADVIFAFTDLLTQEELRDLKGYHLYSMDEVANLGKGSLVEGICIRHPQFEPYVISRDLYGTFTEHAILTIKADAILVCRKDLDPRFIYDVIQTLSEHSQDLKNINPLLYQFSSDFDPQKLSFTLHSGSRKFLDRNAPSFFERYAELLGVIITIVVTLTSTLYTIRKWQLQKKRNKIDVYYQRLISIRRNAQLADSAEILHALKNELRATHEETIELVTNEKLLADTSYMIFLNLLKIANEEIDRKLPLMVGS
ncbi:MAG: hypothetical protein JNJ65_11725 [Cyclobacteriaceae bacterium]|nr:hypothetical protein [Cyclobacteriaceae bacterium]